MNKNNKIVLLVLAFITMVCASTKGRAQVADGMFHSNLTSSGTVFSGSGVLYRIDVSTGDSTNFCILFDTVAFVPAGGGAYAAYTTTQAVTQQMIFLSTQVASNGAISHTKDFTPDGVRINSGLYLYFSQIGNRASVYWRRNKP